MKDLKVSEMMAMQMALWELNKEKWSPMEPAHGKSSLLWMIEEIGEVIAIIKKKQEHELLEDQEVRNKLVEEFADVYMYLTDTLLRYKITPEEISLAYMNKHQVNMERNYQKEYADYLILQNGKEVNQYK